MMIDVLRRRGGGVFFAFWAVSAMLAAQDPTPATATPQDPRPPAAEAGATVEDGDGVPAEAAEPAEEAPTELGRIAVADTPVRCFAGPQSPVFEDLLTEGDVVRLVGEEQNGFVEVALPLGVIGYVHSDFAEKRPDGTVAATAAAVSFRYEPRGGRAPVSTVERGTAFALLGEAERGTWFQVRNPAQTGWIAKERVVRIDDPAALLSAQASWLETKARQRAAVEAAAERERERLAALAAREAMSAKIEALNTRIAEATTQEFDLAAWEALEAEGKALQKVVVEAFPDDAELVRAAAGASEAAYAQRLLARARDFTEQEPELVPPPDLGPDPVADPLADASTGWLRYREPLFREPRIVLEKGGQVLFELECSNGRYDLSVFDGFEVAVHGEKTRPDAESRRVLDISRIDVIGRPRR